jgi:hypothetical protein
VGEIGAARIHLGGHVTSSTKDIILLEQLYMVKSEFLTRERASHLLLSVIAIVFTCMSGLLVRLFAFAFADGSSIRRFSISGTGIAGTPEGSHVSD